MNETYCFWSHRTSGEVWAIRRVGEQITGVCGPLHQGDVIVDHLPDYDYHCTEDVEWMQEHAADFRLYDTVSD
jgi:hypothetical protein